MTEATRTALILWDIDHTLVSARGVGRKLYERAFAETFGRPLGELADMAGRTERAIILETLALNGIAPAGDDVERMCAALGETAKLLDGRLREVGRALPGARAAIDALDRPAVIQSVVTGNIRIIAEAKLEAFELSSGIDFDIGGYGDHSADRADLVRRALGHAAEKYGHVWADRTIVIGDTPHDIRGAHDAGVLALGVATGSSSVQDLAAAGADAVIPSLADRTAVERTVFGTLLGDA